MTSEKQQEGLPEVSVPEVLTFKRSAEIGKLVAAMCKAQLAFDPVYKESENPAFKRGNRVSKYADLFSLVSATRKHLNNNGITIMQFPTVTMTAKNLLVATLVAHESGEWVSHEIMLPAVDERGFTAHSIGKAMTYARRYSWQAVTGAVAEDDDDGNDVSGQGSREAAQAVGEAKVAELKKGRQKAPEAQPEPSQLCVYPNGDGFEVTGEPETMNLYKDVLLANGKKSGVVTVFMTPEQLDTFKFEFCEKRGGILTPLKAAKA